MCKANKFSIMYNKGLERSLKQFEVFCENKRAGCTWKGELASVDNHLKMACPFVQVECLYRCGAWYQRRNDSEHQASCELRPASCAHCHNYSSTYADVVNAHILQCPRYPVPCPKQCSIVLAREALQHHLDDECPLVPVECTFKYAGCSAKLLRKQLQDHMRADVLHHLAMVSVENHKLLMENRTLCEKLLEQEAKNNVILTFLCKSHPEVKKNMPTPPITAYFGQPVEGYNEEEPTHYSMIPTKTDTGTKEMPSYNRNVTFYSHFCGYKMQLRLTVKTLFLNPQIFLMKGEFDDQLYWPFNGVVEVCLKIGGIDYQKSFDFGNAALDASSRVLDGDVSEHGLGSDQAILIPLPEREYMYAEMSDTSDEEIEFEYQGQQLGMIHAKKAAEHAKISVDYSQDFVQVVSVSRRI